MLFPVTFEEQSFRYGPQTFAYADVLGAGVGVSRTKHAVRRSLCVSVRQPNGAPKLVRVQDVDPNIASEMQRRMPERWRGEAPLLAMRKTLGFSNSRIWLITAVIVIFAFVVTGVLVTMAGH